MDSECDQDVVALINAIENFSYHVCDVAIRSEKIVAPWTILSFLHSVSQSVIALIPPGHESAKYGVHRRCLEMMLVLLLGEEKKATLVDKLFAEFCSNGFSSEHNAVSCMENYCRWLKLHGEEGRIEGAIAATKRHLSQDNALLDFQAASDRLFPIRNK